MYAFISDKQRKEDEPMLLGDRYQVQDIIGHSPMATVYRGWDMRMKRIVALKVLKEGWYSTPENGSRFLEEARMVLSFQHPNIVAVSDYGRTESMYFRVMELVEGTNLRRYLRTQGVLPLSQALAIAHEVALGLGAAHRRGVVHSNVKSRNILLDRTDSTRLTDFGKGWGPFFITPEQAQGEPITPATDVYALGCVMYEMLIGRTLFDGDTPVAVAMQHIQDVPTPPSQLTPHIPPALEEIILRCLEKVPQMRFGNGELLAHALASLDQA